MIANKRKTKNPTLPKSILYKSINDKSHVLQLTEGYAIKPSQQQLFSQKFIANGLTISFRGTQLKWNGLIDLSTLQYPLSMLISLGNNSIEVYPDHLKKPKRGKQLNKKCMATFTKMRKMPINHLQKTCQMNNCELVLADHEDNKVMIEIPHFTKYVFECDQEQPQTLPQKLINAQIQRNIKENETNRNQSIQVLKNQTQYKLLPPPHLVQEVNHHNIHNIGHHLVQQGKNITIPHGSGFLFNSFKQSNNLNSIIFSSPTSSNDKLLGELINLFSNPMNINQIVLDHGYNFNIRRVLSLFQICFNFNQIRFKFQYINGDIQLVRLSQFVAIPQKSYLKSWFQWVINKSSIKFPDSQIFSCLAKRKVENLAEKFLKYDAFDQAEFLASIEDQVYRSDESQRKLCKELHRIMLGDLRPFEHEHWLIRIGTLLWYYFFVDFNREIDKILTTSEDGDEFSLQFHMIKLFFGYERTNTVEGCEREEDIPLWWFISNRQSGKERYLFENEKDYHMYRLRMFKKLIINCQYPQVIQKTCMQDQEITKKEKELLMREIIKKKWNDPSFIGEPVLQDFIQEQKGIYLYSQNKYFQAFDTLASLSKPFRKPQITELMIDILEKSSILTGYKFDELEKLQEILQRLDDITFRKYLILFQLRIGKISFNIEIFYMMEELCKEKLTQTTSKRVLNIVYESMGKLTNFNHFISKNTHFYNKLLEVYKYDREKIIAIKIARVSS